MRRYRSGRNARRERGLAEGISPSHECGDSAEGLLVPHQAGFRTATTKGGDDTGWITGPSGADMEKCTTECLKCNKGVLLPLSDYGRDGAPIMYKAWVCNNPDCGFNIRIDNGEISLGRDISTSVK